MNIVARISCDSFFVSIILLLLKQPSFESRIFLMRYEDAKTKRQADRALFRRQHGSHKVYPKHLAILPNDIHVDWLHEEMERAERDEKLHITVKEWEYA